MTDARTSRLVAEISARGLPYAQASTFGVVTLGNASLVGSINPARVSQFRLEVLIPNVEPFMPAIFPTLPGQGIEVTKRQLWSTLEKKHVSGRRVMVGLWQYPMWEWDISWPDYLPDTGWRGDNTRSHLKVVVNFVNTVFGKTAPFLFRDHDDNFVVGQYIGTGDGVTRSFAIGRELGSPDPLLIVREREAATIPASAPYVVTARFASLFTTDYAVQDPNFDFMPKVTGAPASGQYAVSGGTYTFNAADATKTVWLNYDHLAPIAAEPVGFFDLSRPYNFYVNGAWTAPNSYAIDQTTYYDQRVIFNGVPAAGAVLTADFSFYHVCNLGEDVAEFARDFDKMYSLKKLTLRSGRAMAAF
jgi:hypothetical protein